MRRMAFLQISIALLASLAVVPASGNEVDVATWRSDVDFIVEKISSIHPNPWYRSYEITSRSAAVLRSVMKTQREAETKRGQLRPVG
jgi:hypothetical protein